MKTDRHLLRDRRSRGFFAIDNEVLDHYGAEIGPIALAVYMALVRFAGRDDQAFPSHRTIATRLGIARNTVMVALRRLEHVGLISIERQTDIDGTPMAANIYTLLPVSRGGQPPASGHWDGDLQGGGAQQMSTGGAQQMSTPCSADEQGCSANEPEEDSYTKTHDSPPPPTPPAFPAAPGTLGGGGGGGGGESGELTPTERFLLDHQFSAAVAREFRHLDEAAVRRDVLQALAAGQRHGGIVLRWRRSPPQPLPPAAPAPPAAVQDAEPILTPQEVAERARALRATIPGLADFLDRFRPTWREDAP